MCDGTLTTSVPCVRYQSRFSRAESVTQTPSKEPAHAAHIPSYFLWMWRLWREHRSFGRAVPIKPLGHSVGLRSESKQRHRIDRLVNCRLLVAFRRCSSQRSPPGGGRFWLLANDDYLARPCTEMDFVSSDVISLDRVPNNVYGASGRPRQDHGRESPCGASCRVFPTLARRREGTS
jgi:hypothetical protein